jgi:hypothetical protein
MAPEFAQISKIWAWRNRWQILNKCRNFIVCDRSSYTVGGIAQTAGGQSGSLLYLLRTVDCSKSGVADKRLFLALMAIGKKVRVLSG